MSNGYWGKNQNPYWNYNADDALRDQRMRDSRTDAFRSELKASEANNEVDILRQQLNQTIASNSNIVNNYEQRIDKMKVSFFKLAIRSNTFHRTLLRLQEKWPEKKDDILEEIQIARDFCTSEEYRKKWWEWVKTYDFNPEHDYLKFPFEERKPKGPKL